MGGVIRLRVDVPAVDALRRRLGDVAAAQIPFATALALTRTARRARGMTYDAFRQKFDRPTRWVLGPGEKSVGSEADERGILRIEQATKQTLTAQVVLKDRPIHGQMQAAGNLLGHHFTGGGRVPKGVEIRLRRLGLLRQDEFLVLGWQAPQNAYGNLPRGWWNRILSQIERDIATLTTERARRKRLKVGEIFWSAGPGGGRLVDEATGIVYGQVGRSARQHNLPRGVWLRSDDRLVMLLVAVRGAPRYAARFDLGGIGRAAVDKYFVAEFAKAFRDALRTAGFKGSWR